MRHPLLKRLLAFGIDYLVILVYAGVLAAITLLFYRITGLDAITFTPITGQLIGLITLTIPVFLYFYISEQGHYRATFGKRKFDLKVASVSGSHWKRVFWRNVLKLLPWEIAHTGVHWLFYYIERGEDALTWIWVMLVAPQLILVIYFISIILTKGRSSLYDELAGTRVVFNNSNTGKG